MKTRLFPLLIGLVAILLLGLPPAGGGEAAAPASAAEPMEMQALPTFRQIAAGERHTCGLNMDGGVKCWGANYFGQLGDNTTTDRNLPVDVLDLASGVQAIAAGSGQTCALTTGGGVKCWGDNMQGQLGDGTYDDHHRPVGVLGLASGVQAIATGWYHTCALTTGGGVKCWGAIGSELVPAPIDIIGLESGVQAIVAGAAHNCALTTGGGVKCWGYNEYGQLGDGTTHGSSVPVEVSGLASSVQAIAAGVVHTCALTIGGEVKCWGHNSSGQLGDGTTTDRLTPGGVSGLVSGVQAISASAHHTCVLTAGGGANCWGQNGYGQLGDGTLIQRSVPAEVVGLSLMSGGQVIAAGERHTCALTTGGGVKCWGYNEYGQLGDGTTHGSSVPVEVSGLASSVQAIAAGAAHTCALTTGGGVKCWGYNGHGQLGDGTTHSSSVPVDVSGLSSGVQAIATGRYHTCALTTGGGVKCWGYNWYGQLGDGTHYPRRVPVDVSGLSSGVQVIALGDEHTCAVTISGGAKCWGANFSGKLGDGTHTHRNVPVDVRGLTSGVQDIAGGEDHTCALTADGGVKCWGSNGSGQLGDGTTFIHLVPVGVSGMASGVKAIATGDEHTCAVLAGGGMKCWGENRYGQLGDGTTANRRVPVEVSGFSSGGQAVAPGREHTCALTSNGRAKCWGRDLYGQLGIGDGIFRTTPVDVVESALVLTMNYVSGRPGSFFTLTGWNFPPGSLGTLTINERVLTTTLAINPTGSFIFFLDTGAIDEEGFYNVTVRVYPGASAGFFLQADAPLREQEGGGMVWVVPGGIAVPFQQFYLPRIVR